MQRICSAASLAEIAIAMAVSACVGIDVRFKSCRPDYLSF